MLPGARVVYQVLAISVATIMNALAFVVLSPPVASIDVSNISMKAYGSVSPLYVLHLFRMKGFGHGADCSLKESGERGSSVLDPQTSVMLTGSWSEVNAASRAGLPVVPAVQP